VGIRPLFAGKVMEDAQCDGHLTGCTVCGQDHDSALFSPAVDTVLLAAPMSSIRLETKYTPTL